MRVTPTPHTPGGPAIFLGGSSEAAARRAARIADGFFPAVPEVWAFYRDEVLALGGPDPGPCPIDATNRIVFVAEDPDEAWDQMAPYFMHEMNAYGAWQDADDVGAPHFTVEDADELRRTGLYGVVTPEGLVEELRAKPRPLLNLHPLCGGMPIDLAWSSLQLIEERVLPEFAAA